MFEEYITKEIIQVQTYYCARRYEYTVLAEDKYPELIAKIKTLKNQWFKKRFRNKYRYYQLVDYKFDNSNPKKHCVVFSALSKKMNNRRIYNKKNETTTTLATFLNRLELATEQEVKMEKLRLL